MLLTINMTRRERLEKWRELLSVVADDMEEHGEEIHATHLDYTICDIDFEAARLDAGEADLTYKNYP